MSGDVKLNAQGLTDLLRSSSGPVMRDMLVRGTRVQVAMRQLCQKQTGDTANAIVKRPSTFAGRPAVLVGIGDNPKLAENLLRLEQGTPPHEIRAKNKHALSFYSKRVGGRIVVKSVKHPGTKAYRVMTRALERARG